MDVEPKVPDAMALSDERRQLVNRIDLMMLGAGDLEGGLFDAAASRARGDAALLSSQHASVPPHDDEREVRLRRLQTVKAHVRIGFSAKDEQKLIQFASHVAVRLRLNLQRYHLARIQLRELTHRGSS